MSKLVGNLSHGILFILSAPAGTGKTTLIQRLKKEFPNIVQSISTTTRSPRATEHEGVDYFFLDKEAFEKKIVVGEFLEHVELYGYHYGTSKVWVEHQLASGKHVFLVIDTQGAHQLQQHKIAEKVVYIFVLPPSLQVLQQRLESRGTETPVTLQKRLGEAEREIEASVHYDYRIVNDDLETAYQVLKSIVIAEEHRV